MRRINQKCSPQLFLQRYLEVENLQFITNDQALKYNEPEGNIYIYISSNYD